MDRIAGWWPVKGRKEQVSEMKRGKIQKRHPTMCFNILSTGNDWGA
jgi:hypothetical protein